VEEPGTMKTPAKFLYYLSVIIILNCIIILSHEAGHYTAAKSLGLEASFQGFERGVSLFSMNIASVAYVPENQVQVVKVTLAGLWLELVVCTIYILLGSLFRDNETFNIMFIIGMGWLLTLCAFGLNPFIPMPGTDLYGLLLP
jgi:hypothetical protein